MRFKKLLLPLVVLLNAILVNIAHSQSVTIPNYWDPNVRYVKPNLQSAQRLKFLTTTDFPPFNFIDRKKRLSGFNIDLAREICLELEVLAKCQIQALPWNELQTALKSGEGDAIIAGLAVSPETRTELNFTHPYLKIPGRFITKRDKPLTEPLYKSLFKKRVGVVAGSSHQEFFDSAFGERGFEALPTRQLVFNALKEGTVDAVFTDALSASFWLTSPDSGDCCIFSGNAYLSEKYFGKGLSIATMKENKELNSGLNYALKQINDNGKFLELYLKYFPLGLY